MAPLFGVAISLAIRYRDQRDMIAYIRRVIRFHAGALRFQRPLWIDKVTKELFLRAAPQLSAGRRLGPLPHGREPRATGKGSCSNWWWRGTAFGVKTRRQSSVREHVQDHDCENADGAQSQCRDDDAQRLRLDEWKPLARCIGNCNPFMKQCSASRK